MEYALSESMRINKYLWPDERCVEVRVVYGAFRRIGLYPTVVENNPRRLIVDARHEQNNISARVCARFLYDDATPGIINWNSLLMSGAKGWNP